MEEKYGQQQDPVTGLVAKVRSQIRDTLADVFPIWQAEPPVDSKRVLRPTGAGNFSINVEPYRGSLTYLNARAKIDKRESVKQLNETIRTSQPELSGYVVLPGRCNLIQYTVDLAIHWCKIALESVEKGSTVDAALDKIIADLDYVLTTKTAKLEIFTPLNGLKLPDGIEEIPLSGNVNLRRISGEEVAELGSQDVMLGSLRQVEPHHLTTALVITTNVNIALQERYPETSADFSFQQGIQDQIDTVVHSLHVLKQGRVGAVANHQYLRPDVLPGMEGYTSMPLVFNPIGSMELNRDEIKLFVATYQDMVKTQREEIRIASARLVDAKNRLSPVDSLLDAVIGLETLLNPNDYAELSFRVALNYAYLAEESERRNRYEAVRDIQKTRNRVVHGGLNLHSKDAQTIRQHAQLAADCLRDAINRFLRDEALSGNKKLDADFWLDRVIPPHSKELLPKDHP